MTSETKTLHSAAEARIRREVIAIRDEEGWPPRRATASSPRAVA